MIAGVAMPIRFSVLRATEAVLGHLSPDLALLTATVGRDPALSGHLIRTAHREAGKVGRCIDSVEQAVTLLGLSRIREIVVKLPANPAAEEAGGMLQRVADRGMAIGRIAARLADLLPGVAMHFPGYLQPVASSTAYTLGLLHDCGLVLLASRLPEYLPFCQSEITTHGNVRANEEQRLFGTDHGLAGAHLAKAWGLPDLFCQAIRDHNQAGNILQPSRKSSLRQAAALHGILALAEWLLARLAGSGPTPPLPDDLSTLFGIDPATLERLYRREPNDPLALFASEPAMRVAAWRPRKESP